MRKARNAAGSAGSLPATMRVNAPARTNFAGRLPALPAALPAGRNSRRLEREPG